MNAFKAYGIEHWAPLLLAFTAGWLCIKWASNLDSKRQKWLGFYLSLTLPGIVVYDMLSHSVQGSFDLKLHLPLFMCRLVTFLIPVLMWTKHRGLFGILYYWVLAGTSQAILTPDIARGFPSYEYLRYWILHCGLIASIIYALILFKFEPSIKDLWKAIVAAQVYLLMTIPINWMLGSNYGYTMEKPSMGSLADLLGPWPWYILSGELVMIALFLLLYLPFGIRKKI